MRLLAIQPYPHRSTPGRHVPLPVLVTLVFGLMALFFPTAQPVFAATILVTDLVDRQLTDPMADNGSCSLREAIQAANFDNNNFPALPGVNDCPAGSGADTITFNSSGTISLIDQLQIDTNITINGPITISGANTGGNAPFRVISTGTLTLNFVIIKDSLSGGGGAILNEGGTVNTFVASFENNTAMLSGGGAINSTGNLNIMASNFAGNKATDANAGFGGAIFQSGPGTFKVTASAFNGNTAAKNGGAIYTNGKTNIVEDTAFNGNIANGVGDPDNDGQFDTDAGGGAIFNNSETLNISTTAFNGNLSPNGSGGALFLKGTSAITNTSFNGNIAGDLNSNGRGGAIYNDRSLSVAQNLIISHATFNGNLSLSQGIGGALTNNKGGVQISNTTFFSNIAGSSGGAISNIDSSNLSSEAMLTLINATLANNAAPISGTPGLFNQNQEIVKLQNTIIANDFGIANCAGDIARIQDLGHNLQFPGSDCGSTITVGNPNLDTPLFNGGSLPSLLTQKPKPGSAAIDQGDNTVCAAAPVDNEDQRGESRPKDGDGNFIPTCDIGALETDTLAAGYGSTPVQPGPIVFGNATVNTSINASFSVFETGNTTLQVSGPTLSGPNPNDFSLVTGFPVNIADGAPATPIQLTCTPSAEGPRSATLTLQTNDPNHPSVSYTLLCNGTPIPTPGFNSTPIAPGPVDFGQGFAGNSLNTSLNLQETGNAPLIVSNPALGGVNPGDFTVVTAFPITIADGGGAQPVQLTCQPSALGIRTAILTLDTNDPTQPTVSFNLTCTGIVPPDPSLAFGSAVTDVNGAYALAASSDGKHLYVAGTSSHNIRVFSRNSVSGVLADVMTYANVNIQNPKGIAVSPDGNNVYVVSAGATAATKSLVVLNRNAANGQIFFGQVIKDSDVYLCQLFPVVMFCPIDGLDGGEDVVVSPDGKHVYVVSSTSNAVAVFNRNPADGMLAFVHRLKQGLNGVTGLEGARDVAISPDGTHVYVASAPPGIGSGGTVAVFSRNAATGVLTFVTSYTDGTGGLDELNGAMGVAVSPDGAHVYVAAFWDQAVTAFQRNPGDGKLTLAATYKDGIAGVDGLNGARDLAVSPDGKRLYVAAINDNSLTVFSRNAATGVLSFVDIYRNGVGGVTNLNGAAQVATSPDGAHLYVTSFTGGAVVLFSVANPIPTIDNLSPASAPANSGVSTITVNGEDFFDGSQVKWNGSDRPTTFLNNTQLRVDLGPGDLNGVGTVDISVVNPTPGGGSSNLVKFTITAPDENPIPAIDLITPQAAAAGDPAFTLDLKGTNFLPGSKVQWNGADRSTSFISSTRLQAEIPAEDIAAGGLAGVIVVNPAPGGGPSNAVLFSIAAPGQNPAPSITTLDPPSIIAAGAASAALPLKVIGLNFVDGAKVRWNGVDRPTTFVSETMLEITAPAADLAAPGAASVTVRNPAPGGGDSNTVTFTIGKPGDNPVPLLTGFALTVPGDGTATLTVDGSGFVNSSVAQWNGANRPTGFVSNTRLTASLTGSDLSSGSAVITVFNPGPGGGLSNDLLFIQQLIYIPLIHK